MAVPRWTWVAKQDTLLKFLDSIEGASWLALDTEFLRISTYYPKLCLIQVSDGTEHALIDAQAGLDLSGLIELLRRPDEISVMHACLQDVEIMHHDFDLIPGKLFDTQIAWALLGRGFQVSYAAMVEEMLGIVLDKSEVRSWWDRRPLKPSQIQYALRDVVYLGPVYQQLKAELEAKGRLAWLQEELERNVTPSVLVPNLDHIWKRIKIPNREISSSQLHVLQELARWRELIAQRQNRARTRVASDDVLVALSSTAPQNRDDFERIVADKIPRKLYERLWKVLQKAYRLPPITRTFMNRNARTEMQRKTRILAGVARKIAEDIEVSPELLAPRAMLEDLVQQNPDPVLLQGWRGKTVGPALTQAIDAL